MLKSDVNFFLADFFSIRIVYDEILWSRHITWNPLMNFLKIKNLQLELIFNLLVVAKLESLIPEYWERCQSYERANLIKLNDSKIPHMFYITLFLVRISRNKDFKRKNLVIKSNSTNDLEELKNLIKDSVT